MRSAQTHDRPIAPPAGLSVAFVVMVWLALFAIRLAGPPDLLDNGQRRPEMYVLDVLQNGHWICQRHDSGEVSSKPPLHTWLAALASLPLPRANRFSLTLPGALATLAVAILLFTTGLKHFGGWAGLFAAVAYLVSNTCARQVVLIRTDGLFTLTVMLTALAAFRAWRLGRGWTWFWLAATAATLTKGPLGVVLGGSGLLAAWWERRSGERAPIRGPHWTGLALFALIVGGWFALAWMEMGPALKEKMVDDELVGRAVGSDRGIIGAGLFKPSLYFLVRFAPWSLLACLAFWRVCRHPSADATQRRFERFLFCWFFAGLLIFSLAVHQRWDLLFPLMPVAALFAGRELSRLTAAARPVWILAGLGVVAAGGLALIGDQFGAKMYGKERTLQTQALQKLARAVHERVGEGFPLTHVDSEATFQFYLNTMRLRVSEADAIELLQSDDAVFVAVGELCSLLEKTELNGRKIHTVARWPVDGSPFVAILSNHPRLEWTERMATIIGPLLVRTENLRLTRTRAHELTLVRNDRAGAVKLTNRSRETVRTRVRIIGFGPEVAQDNALAPGERWTVRCLIPQR